MNKKILITILFSVILLTTTTIVSADQDDKLNNGLFLNGKANYDQGYDCSNVPLGTFSECKLIVRKQAWFMNKGFEILWGAYYNNGEFDALWYRAPKA